jgi:hypothetical protein
LVLVERAIRVDPAGMSFIARALLIWTATSVVVSPLVGQLLAGAAKPAKVRA